MIEARWDGIDTRRWELEDSCHSAVLLHACDDVPNFGRRHPGTHAEHLAHKVVPGREGERGLSGVLAGDDEKVCDNNFGS